MTQNIKPQILRCVKLLFFVAVAIIPLIFYINVKRHYEFPKTTMARYLIIPMIMFFFITFAGRFAKAKNPFRWPILLLLTAACLSALRSVNLCETLDSKYLFDMFLFALLTHFVVAARFKLKDLHFYALLLTIAGLVSALYGIIQFYEAEDIFLKGPLKALAVKGQRTEPVAFQGNRNYSSEFYNLAIPMTLALLFSCRSWSSRLFYVLCFLAMRYHVLIADTRATEVGLAFAVPLVLLILFWTHRKEWPRLVFLIICFLPLEHILDTSVRHNGFHGWTLAEWGRIFGFTFIVPMIIWFGYYFGAPALLQVMNVEKDETHQPLGNRMKTWAVNIFHGRNPGYATSHAQGTPRTRRIQHLFLFAVVTFGIIFGTILTTYSLTRSYHQYQIQEKLFHRTRPVYSSFFKPWLGPRTLSYQKNHPDYEYKWRREPIDPKTDWTPPDFTQYVKDRIDKTFFWDRSITFRIEVYNSALAIARDNVLLGIGVGTFKIVHDLYTSQLERFVLGKEVLARKVHNEYLTYACMHGAFGLMALFWIQMITLKIAFRIFRAYRQENQEAMIRWMGSSVRARTLFFLALGVFSGLVVNWVSMVFGHSLTLPTSHFLVWASLGLLVCLYHRAFWPATADEPEESEEKKNASRSWITRLPGMQNIHYRLGAAVALSLILTTPIFFHWMGENLLQNGMQMKNWVDFFTTQQKAAKSRGYNDFQMQQHYRECYKVFYHNSPRLAEKSQYHSFDDAIPGMVNELFDLFDQSIRIWPFHMETYYILGRYCIDFNRPELGIDVLRQDLFMNPNYKWAQNNLGVLYDQEGQYQKARDVYYRALMIDPQQIFAHYNLAQSYWKKDGNYPLAIKHLYGVLDSNPNRLDVYGQLAFCLREEKRYKEAEKVLDDYFLLRKTVKKTEDGYVENDFPNYQILLAVYRETGEYERLFSVYQNMMQKYPDAPNIREAYTRDLLKAGRAKEAMDELKKLSYLAPKDPKIPLQMAEVSLELNAPTGETIRYLKKALELGGAPYRMLAKQRPKFAPLIEMIEAESGTK